MGEARVSLEEKAGVERVSDVQVTESSRPSQQASDSSRVVENQVPVDGDAPIAYHYLTFATPLPNADLRSGSGEELPGCPSLAPYSNPLQWPATRKHITLALFCIATMLTTYAAGAYSPPIDLMAAEFGASRPALLAGTTTFCVGFAIAPMFLAPFSEFNGRYPIFVASGVVFVLFQAIGGVAANLATALVARFFSGFGSSVFSTMIGGVIADLWGKEERNLPMAIYSGSVLVGTGLGPLAASLMSFQWGGDGVTGPTARWRWVFWHQVIMDGACVLAIIFLFKESRGSVLLSRKARALNGWYEALEKKGAYGVWMPGPAPNQDGLASLPQSGKEPKVLSAQGSHAGPAQLQRIRWHVKEDEHRASISQMIRASLIRPFHLLFAEPVVFFFSLWASFSWAVLFLSFNAIPLVFRRQYGFNQQQTGLVFIAMVVGSAVATILGVLQEEVLKHSKWQPVTVSASASMDVSASEDAPPKPKSAHDKFWSFIRHHFPVDAPESRLYVTCITSIMLPFGLYLFGFAAQPSIHWIVPAIGIGLSTFGIYTIYLSTFNYLADSYGMYASSALAAQGFCRYVLGGIFPLVVEPLFVNLGEDAAGGLLGTVATVLTAVPWVLAIFGHRIRKRSKFALSLED